MDNFDNTDSKYGMDSILISSTTGLIGVSSLVLCAMPELARSTIRRVTANALKNTNIKFKKQQEGKAFVNVLNIHEALFMMTNISCKKWKKWYSLHGYAFKVRFVKHFKSITGSTTFTGTVPEAPLAPRAPTPGEPETPEASREEPGATGKPEVPPDEVPEASREEPGATGEPEITDAQEGEVKLAAAYSPIAKTPSSWGISS
ncbi:FirrV-1-G1 precursor [Feldmannia irregularis virus a]|uniref:FirrV-1-G1 n=1 Tax=Feldmannia irregularis virus a TaxID=231992 RepID=Q6XLV2_9PHYC|nr:FirrV-1-G1 precursor [Feldmannia irregularis virus a]AAR26959.1 FirrV-1-G1 precursor [Feldmannia irregularis virus a]